MRWLLRWVTESFVTTFGITRPEPGQEERAGLWITAMMLVLLAGMALLTWVLLRMW